jgi:osmotically-inducible protein OsmY
VPDATDPTLPGTPATPATPATPEVPPPAASTTPPPASTDPANTAINQRDADGDTKTPIDQDENSPDVKRTAEIRRKVLDQPDLSINARNVKIITSQGKVTLRGPVNTEAERDTIVRIAREVAGEANVDNQIEIATP